VDVIEWVSAEVLAVIFYYDFRADEVVGGIAAGGEGAMPGEVGFLELGIELSHAGFGWFGREVIDPEADEF
jgi:hypothetical protein